MNGISMLVLSVGGIIAVLFFVTYAAQKHDLNGIKDKTVGNGQHGTARWATDRRFSVLTTMCPSPRRSGGKLRRMGTSPLPMGSRFPKALCISFGVNDTIKWRSRTRNLFCTGLRHPA